MRVLAIGAHPDDIEIACSGTLAKCVKRGDKVIVCHASTGNLGHVIIPPDELTKIRKKEAETAGSLAGIEVIGGMFDDLDIFDNNKAARDKMVEVIKYARPILSSRTTPTTICPTTRRCRGLCSTRVLPQRFRIINAVAKRRRN